MSNVGAFERKHAVVLGGAGFLGSHLSERLVEHGALVTCVDNSRTGSSANVEHLIGPSFRLIEADIVNHVHVAGHVDFVFNFASPASPAAFERYAIEILETGGLGTHNGLRLALTKAAVFVQASTSEVYGDPLVSPQSESYWGNVNPIGIRAAYDEAKRYGEALTMAYRRRYGVETRIARIFNTYGPRMRPDDGRVVPAFFSAALTGASIPVHGDGSQTRSLCYVDDLIDGVLGLALSNQRDPVNLGSPSEITVLELAETIRRIVGSESPIVFHERPPDDPSRRRPDSTTAREVLGWEPKVPLEKGLKRSLTWFMDALGMLRQDEDSSSTRWLGSLRRELEIEAKNDVASHQGRL